LLIISLNHGFLGFRGRRFIVVKIIALLSLLAPKKVTKKRHPLPGPVKRVSLVSGFFAVGVTMVRIRRDSDMRRLNPQKNLVLRHGQDGAPIFHGHLW